MPQTSQQSSQARPQQNITKPEQAEAKLQQSTNGTTRTTPKTVCVYDRSWLRRSVHHHAGGAHSSSLEMENPKLLQQHKNAVLQLNVYNDIIIDPCSS